MRRGSFNFVDTVRRDPSDSRVFFSGEQVKASRGYWSKLPQTVCAHEKYASSGEADCWNGKERAR